MDRVWIFNALQLAATGYAFWRGGAPERLTGLALLLAALATLSGPAKPPWRPWAIGAACGVGVTVALVAAFA